MNHIYELLRTYILNHPNDVSLKPSSDKFDIEKLYDIVKCLPFDTIEYQSTDIDQVMDFCEISKYYHDMFVEMYKIIKDDFNNLNTLSFEIPAYLVATLNREYKVIKEKHRYALENVKEGTYELSDLTNFKLVSSVKEVGLIDARASMEGFTDGVCLVLNFLRHFPNQNFACNLSNSKEFAGRILHILQCASVGIIFKQTYDDSLYNEGYIHKEENTIIFDYYDYGKLKLLRAGDLMFGERKMQKFMAYMSSKNKFELLKILTPYRIKKAVIEDGCIFLSFGSGNPKQMSIILTEIQSSLEAFYEFLDINMVLPMFCGATLGECLAVWAVCQYIAIYVADEINFDVALYERSDYAVIPYRIGKENLFSAIEKLTKIKRKKIVAVLSALTANNKNYSDIWSTPLYANGENYLYPLYPIIYSSPYNMFDQLLEKGGCNLDERGKWFEKYLYKELTEKKSSFPVICIPSRKYPIENGKVEEIDLIVSLRDIVVVVEAKCVHYSMERKNYYEAWNRLKEGCNQALRKADFVKAHADLFSEIGDFSDKQIIPIVVTNYPTFTGFSYENIFVIDHYSFLSYMHAGMMSIRMLSRDNTPVGMTRFYTDETTFSSNFYQYLIHNPLKDILMKQISIEDNIVLPNSGHWKCVCKSAVVNNSPEFNIQ